MSKVRPPYPAECRQQMVEFVRIRRSPAEYSREFIVTAQPITNWVGHAAIDSGKPLTGKEGLTTAEREALVRLRRQLRQALMERDILGKETTVCPAGRSNATSTKSSNSLWQTRPTCQCEPSAESWAYRAAGTTRGTDGFRPRAVLPTP